MSVSRLRSFGIADVSMSTHGGSWMNFGGSAFTTLVTMAGDFEPWDFEKALTCSVKPPTSPTERPFCFAPSCENNWYFDGRTDSTDASARPSVANSDEFCGLFWSDT